MMFGTMLPAVYSYMLSSITWTGVFANDTAAIVEDDVQIIPTSTIVYDHMKKDDNDDIDWDKYNRIYDENYEKYFYDGEERYDDTDKSYYDYFNKYFSFFNDQESVVSREGFYHNKANNQNDQSDQSERRVKMQPWSSSSSPEPPTAPPSMPDLLFEHVYGFKPYSRPEMFEPVLGVYVTADNETFGSVIPSVDYIDYGIRVSLTIRDQMCRVGMIIMSTTAVMVFVCIMITFCGNARARTVVNESLHEPLLKLDALDKQVGDLTGTSVAQEKSEDGISSSNVQPQPHVYIVHNGEEVVESTCANPINYV